MIPGLADLEHLADMLAERYGGAKVLVIVEAEREGVMAACTPPDGNEARGLMFRAAAALPDGKLRP